MRELRYIENVVSLQVEKDRCTGCKRCVEVCPHAVFAMNSAKAEIIDRDACMECGACAQNCPVTAITVQAGVGCATAVIQSYLKGGETPCCGCDEVTEAATSDSCGSTQKSSCC